jgi:hypothetical protein
MSLSPPTVISSGGRSATIATVVSAFASDPVERWLYPADEEYERHFPEFAGAFGGRAFEGGTAWALEGVAAVALWLAPGIEPDEDAVGAVLAGSVAEEKHEERERRAGLPRDPEPAQCRLLRTTRLRDRRRHRFAELSTADLDAAGRCR